MGDKGTKPNEMGNLGTCYILLVFENKVPRLRSFASLRPAASPPPYYMFVVSPVGFSPVYLSLVLFPTTTEHTYTH